MWDQSEKIKNKENYFLPSEYLTYTDSNATI